MQNQFKSADGLVEVNISKQGDSWLYEGQSCQILTDGRLQVTTADGSVHLARAAKVGDVWWIHISGHTFKLERIEPGANASEEQGGLTAPMPGKVLEVMVSVGQEVSAGTTLMILEAMKMEHKIVASTDGTVTAINFNAGDQVEQGVNLLDLEE